MEKGRVGDLYPKRQDPSRFECFVQRTRSMALGLQFEKSLCLQLAFSRILCFA